MPQSICFEAFLYFSRLKKSTINIDRKMSYFDVVKQQLFKFENLSKEVTRSGAVLIGHAPHIAPMAWLHSIYPVLTEEDIIELEAELKKPIPEAYRDFLKNYSNGLALLQLHLLFMACARYWGELLRQAGNRLL
jgi:hypothetical protein